MYLWIQMDSKNQKRVFENVKMNSFRFISIYSHLLEKDRWANDLIQINMASFSDYFMIIGLAVL